MGQILILVGILLSGAAFLDIETGLIRRTLHVAARIILLMFGVGIVLVLAGVLLLTLNP
jgi:hypothetical protein